MSAEKEGRGETHNLVTDGCNSFSLYIESSSNYLLSMMDLERETDYLFVQSGDFRSMTFALVLHRFDTLAEGDDLKNVRVNVIHCHSVLIVSLPKGFDIDKREVE